MLRSLVYRLLPLRCVVCELHPGAPATSICTQCEADFFAADTARCERCAICVPDGQTGAPRICGRCLANEPHFDATTTLADYVSPVDGMVIALKFTARLDLAQFFGRLLASRLSSAMAPATDDAVVMPVPLAFERARQRGFDLRFHDLRGSHETLLLDAGVPVHVVAARCGHDPAVLLHSYAKRTRKADTSAAAVIGAMAGNVLRGS